MYRTPKSQDVFYDKKSKKIKMIITEYTTLIFFIAKFVKTYIIGVSLERRLMVGQEILVLFIMVRIRALQPKIQPVYHRFLYTIFALCVPKFFQQIWQRH